MSTTLRPRREPYCTAPAVSANRVSSLPRPTLLPGWILVPRWRIRISPALTTCPPKRLTPRNCAFESRPLRVELAPFLVAMADPAFVKSYWTKINTAVGKPKTYAIEVTFTRVCFRSEEHTSELQSRGHIVCRLLRE